MDELPQSTQNKHSGGVRHVEVTEHHQGQRLDNFLLREVKGAPKSLIYRILRKGEVRLNKKRAKPSARVVCGDIVRIPPVSTPDMVRSQSPDPLAAERLCEAILYEDRSLLVINKPSGLAVHGGSGVAHGLIERLRSLQRYQSYLELVHRLDRDTSGCLVLAKNRPALIGMHQALRSDKVRKAYQALVAGRWPKSLKAIEAPLKKNELKSGERIVVVDGEGKASKTRFGILRKFPEATLVQATLDTGRTHQIRVHAQLAGHPILGDGKYSSAESLKVARELRLKRLFLHAAEIEFPHPDSGEQLRISAQLPGDLSTVLNQLRG